MTLPTEIDFALPDDLAALPPRDPRAWMDGCFAKLDDRKYVKARLPLALRDRNAKFEYRCWARLSDEQFILASRLVAEPDLRGRVTFMGVLANALPPFEAERSINIQGAMPHGAEMLLLRAAEGELGAAQVSPGITPIEHGGIVGEAQAALFAAAVERFLVETWGPLKAAEEFRGRDWRRGPRLITIAEFPPAKGAGWRYATLGLSSRPMPGTKAGAELAWEFEARVEDPGTFSAMAQLAALPWRLEQPWGHAQLQRLPTGFPPGAATTWALFADGSAWDDGLMGCSVAGRPVRFLKVVPITEAERPANSADLEARLRAFVTRRV